MSAPASPNVLSPDWAREQFSRLQPQAQADVREVLKILGPWVKGPSTRARRLKATARLNALRHERDWPSWVLYAIRDIVGTAWEHGVKL